MGAVKGSICQVRLITLVSSRWNTSVFGWFHLMLSNEALLDGIHQANIAGKIKTHLNGGLTL